MANILEWLEKLIGSGNIGAPRAPVAAPVAPVPGMPPAIAPGAVDTSVAPVNVLDNGPKLNDLVPPEDPIGVLSQGPIQTQGLPLNTSMGIEPPDPNRVQNTGPLVPEQVPVDVSALTNVPTIAPPPAIIAPIAARKRSSAPVMGVRPTSQVNVAGTSKQAQGVEKFSRPPRLLTPNAPKPKPRPYKWSGKGVDWSKNNLMKR